MDHLVYACPDLRAGVRSIEALLGVEASEGGRHEGLGTRNALVGLGPDSYLEIVSVDPDQPSPSLPRWFGLDALRAARLVTWSAKSDRLHDLVKCAAAEGVDLGSVIEAGRRRPDASRLEWTFTDPRADRLGGTVPFFIDWGESEHPAGSLQARCTFEGLAAEHPEPEHLTTVLRALGVEMPVASGVEPRLVARIDTPNGLVELR